ncbi:MAG: tetratricopeptide repeat protein [bacterium]|nr:tetratricopeptide repeat protein [bacterium]
MNFIKELINAARCGSFAGKGNKATRKGFYGNALNYYKKALELSDNIGGSATYLHCIARTHAKLEDYENALSTAEKSLILYIDLNSSAPVIKEEIKRLTYFIEALKNKDKKKVIDIIAI